jgi:hypothetical protein
MRRVAQMEITPLEGDNASSGGRNLHPELPQANMVALFYTAYEVASGGWRLLLFSDSSPHRC